MAGIRPLLVGCLWAYMSYYVYVCLRKYNRGQVATAEEERERTAFIYPSVGVCGVSGEGGGDDPSSRWVLYASQYFVGCVKNLCFFLFYVFRIF